MDQPNVDHTGDRVRAINGGSPILQDIDMVDQPKGNGVEVDRITGKANRRETTSVLQDQSFLSENTAQVNFHAAVTAVGLVFIDCRSRSGWQLLDKVSGGTYSKPGNVLPAISIDRVGTDFF